MTKVGDRIKLTFMGNDPAPIPEGATGTVTLVNKTSWGDQVSVSWDPPNETRSLMLLEGDDEWEVINA